MTLATPSRGYHAAMDTPYSAELITLQGADTLAFAQAQFSSNVAALEPSRWQFSAWLDARGRVRALFHLLWLEDERLLLLLRGGAAAPLARALGLYVLRSKVRIEAATGLALGTAPALACGLVEAKAGDLILGCGRHALVIGRHGDSRWRLEQIRAGWPWLPTGSLLDTLLPPALGLRHLQATALDKGCYPGQEIVARLHYRGGHKHHLHHVRLSRPVPPGTVLESTTGPVQLLDVAAIDEGAEALAILHDELAQTLSLAPLTLAGTRVEWLASFPP